MAAEFNFPVWATQGGGLARECGGKYFFVTDPGFPGLGIGDEVPEEWGLAPANEKACDEMDAFAPGSSF